MSPSVANTFTYIYAFQEVPWRRDDFWTDSKHGAGDTCTTAWYSLWIQDPPPSIHVHVNVHLADAIQRLTFAGLNFRK